jgi:repressor LexA
MNVDNLVSLSDLFPEAIPGIDIQGKDAGELYALQVEGNSMIDALVTDGDIIVVIRQQRVENGEMALVWMKEREEMMLKRLYREEGGRVRLQPANPAMSPIYLDASCQGMDVLGKLVMVIRQMQ